MKESPYGSKKLLISAKRLSRLGTIKPIFSLLRQKIVLTTTFLKVLRGEFRINCKLAFVILVCIFLLRSGLRVFVPSGMGGWMPVDSSFITQVA